MYNISVYAELSMNVVFFCSIFSLGLTAGVFSSNIILLSKATGDLELRVYSSRREVLTLFINL